MSDINNKIATVSFKRQIRKKEEDGFVDWAKQEHIMPVNMRKWQPNQNQVNQG